MAWSIGQRVGVAAVGRPPSGQDLLERPPADVLHHDVARAPVGDEVVDDDDGGVVELGQEPALGHGHGHGRLVAGVEEALEHHPAVVDRLVPGQVDPAQAAVGQAPHDLVLAADDLAPAQLGLEVERVAAGGAEARRPPGGARRGDRPTGAPQLEQKRLFSATSGSLRTTAAGVDRAAPGARRPGPRRWPSRRPAVDRVARLWRPGARWSRADPLTWVPPDPAADPAPREGQTTARGPATPVRASPVAWAPVVGAHRVPVPPVERSPAVAGRAAGPAAAGGPAGDGWRRRTGLALAPQVSQYPSGSDRAGAARLLARAGGRHRRLPGTAVLTACR